ncbi:MAG: hypothetical protein LBI49_15815, partial [Nocardiopsaceae bacterium]|nr:hypothetical protein [Nocardiopsaceae bacterium]
AAVTALTSGYHVAFGTGAGLAVAALIVATVSGRPRQQRPGGTGQDPGAVTPASRAAATSGG